MTDGGECALRRRRIDLMRRSLRGEGVGLAAVRRSNRLGLGPLLLLERACKSGESVGASLPCGRPSASPVISRGVELVELLCLLVDARPLCGAVEAVAENGGGGGCDAREEDELLATKRRCRRLAASFRSPRIIDSVRTSRSPSLLRGGGGGGGGRSADANCRPSAHRRRVRRPVLCRFVRR